MRSATKLCFGLGTALLLATTSAFGAAGEESIVESLKSKAGEALPKNVTEPGFAPRREASAPAQAASAPAGPQGARFPSKPVTASTAPERVSTKLTGTASQASSVTAFPETKPATSEGGYPVKTVRELLDLEAKMSLLKSKERFDALQQEKSARAGGTLALGRPNAPVVPVGPPPEVLDLLAVFGHGNVRFASVYFNGQSFHRLTSGSRIGPYTLSSINDACVLLTKDPQAQPAPKKGKKPDAIITERHLCITETPTAPAGMRVFGPGPTPAVPLGGSVPQLRQAGPAVFQ